MEFGDIDKSAEEAKKFREYLSVICDKLSNTDAPITDLVIFIRNSDSKDTMYWAGDTLICSGACSTIRHYIEGYSLRNYKEPDK